METRRKPLIQMDKLIVPVSQNLSTHQSNKTPSSNAVEDKSLFWYHCPLQTLLKCVIMIEPDETRN
jgi:hypothetical protein